MYTGPHIVEDGLIFGLDAGSSRCFTSGNTTATDLVQGFNCSGANGFPGAGTHTPNTANFPVYNSVNNGVFDFAGGKGINVDGNLGSTSASSICFWIYYPSGASVRYLTDGRNDGGQWFLMNYQSFNFNWTANLQYNFENPFNNNATDFVDQWIHMVATSNNSGSKIYINGVEKATTTSSSADEDFGVNYRIGTRYTTSSQFTGKLGPMYFYNKVLSAAEINQNYNAQQSRFL